MNLRPYRHSGIQNDMLEEMVMEILKTRIIRASTFCFPSGTCQEEEFNLEAMSGL
jgi:hypothetical protein